MMNEKNLREIYDKTSGHCHFCGDPIKFENRGGAVHALLHATKDSNSRGH